MYKNEDFFKFMKLYKVSIITIIIITMQNNDPMK